MYADDTAISSLDKIGELNSVINVELGCLEKWLQSNKLSLNIAKTQVMIIGPCFQVNGNEIDIFRETKYLGVMIDEKFKWSNQAKFLQKEMCQSIGLLKYVKQFVYDSTLRDMYPSIIEPKVSYCCSISGCFSDTKLNTLQQLQNRTAELSRAAHLINRLLL